MQPLGFDQAEAASNLAGVAPRACGAGGLFAAAVRAATPLYLDAEAKPVCAGQQIANTNSKARGAYRVTGPARHFVAGEAERCSARARHPHRSP
jgi:hypothetical protein